MTTPLKDLVREEVQRQREVKLAGTHPAHLLVYTKCVDNTTGETFQFQLVDEDEPWHWQREVLDEWMGSSKSITLKARQIGITWLAAGYGLWLLLYRPGSKMLAVSINEAEAVKVVNRVWDMYLSLPEHLKAGVKVIKPKGSRPSKLIEFLHPDGRMSTMIGLPSTPNAGHGETAALVLLDEFSRQEYAQQTWKACLPTTQKEGGRIIAVATGNGRGSNFFYQLWTNAEEFGLKKRFLPWSLHPDRDTVWYEAHAMALPSADRGEQYPRTPEEAFILTGRPYFDVEALRQYEDLVPEPLFRGDFVQSRPEKAALKKSELGYIRVYKKPVVGRTYAIGADVATGRGADYSAAYVVDLGEMEIVAEFHGKLDADLFATQLHYLGRWYNTALLAVETGGGFGEAVLIPLRDGREGRRPYSRLYRHLLSNRPDLPTAKPFGFPMNSKTRPLAVSQMEKAIRDRSLPFLTERLLFECGTFVHHEAGTTPRAQDGCHDDTVMACAIALEMYRLRGHHPEKDKRKRRLRGRKQRYESLYPWQEPDTTQHDRDFNERYPAEVS